MTEKFQIIPQINSSFTEVRDKKDLETTLRAFGNNSNQIINLVGLYNIMGDYEKALPLYQRTLDIQENVLGLQHPTVAATLNNLAELYHQMGEYEKALPLHQRALKILEDSLGPEHSDVAVTLNNLAIFYSDRGEYEEALPLLERAVDIVKKNSGLVIRISYNR